MIRYIVPILFLIAGGVISVRFYPPQIAPWWDCPIGYGSKNMDARIRLITSCLTDNSLNDIKRSWAYYRRGNAYASKGQFEYALDDYSEAIRLRSDLRDAYFNRAKTYEELDQPFQALQDYDQVLRITPTFAGALYLRAMIHLELGQDAEVLNDLNLAIKNSPRFFRAFYARSLVHHKNKDFIRAIRDITSAIHIHPKKAKYLLTRAQYQLENQKYVSAIHDADKAIELSQDKTNSFTAAQTRKYLDGFNLALSRFAVLEENNERFEAYPASIGIWVDSYMEILLNSPVDRIHQVQAELKYFEHYKGPTDGIYRPRLVDPLNQCAISKSCRKRLMSHLT